MPELGTFEPIEGPTRSDMLRGGEGPVVSEFNIYIALKWNQRECWEREDAEHSPIYEAPCRHYPV